jgi:hypothetical protein
MVRACNREASREGGRVSDQKLDYAVLISLYTREEAEVMAGALRADGIDAFLGNTNHAGLNWFYLIALGGIQVMVPHARLADAKAAMRERVKENADAFPEDRAVRRDRWKLWLILAWLCGPLVFAWLEYFLVPAEFWIYVPDTLWPFLEAIS